MASFASMGEPPFAYDPSGKPTKSILKHKASLSRSSASWFSTFNSKLTAASLSFPPDNSVTDSSVTAATAASDNAKHLASSVSQQPQQQQQQQQQRSSLGLLNFRKFIGTLPSNGSSDTLGQNLSDKVAVDSNDELAPEELRRVRFSVKKLTTEYYPYHNQSSVKDKDKDNEENDDPKSETSEPLETQAKGNELSTTNSNDLFDIYSAACKDKEEPLFSPFVACLNSHQRLATLTRVDLSNQPLNRRIVEPIADIIGLDVGLEYLNLNNCNLEDDALRILLHALLLSDTLRNLNLANNRKLKANGFKYIAIYIKQSSKLEYLDLSFTNPEKKGVQYLAQSMAAQAKQGHTSSLNSLIMDGCALKPPVLEVLASGVRKSSSLRRLSLRQNKINNQGALWLGVMLRDYDDQDLDKGLEELDVTNNDIRAGIQYIAQALRRNKSLQKLSLCDCKIDSKGCALIGEALKYNQSLESLDISQNALCKPTTEGMTAIKHALYVNTSLKSFNMSSSGLGTDAAVALAECIPENGCLTRLDLSNNLDIDLAGLMALSASMRINQTLSFLDISIPSNDREMAKIQRDIAAACTKNAQNSASSGSSPSMQRTSSSSSLDRNATKSTTQATARLTLQERLAAVTRGKSSSPSLRSSSSISERPRSPENNTRKVVIDSKLLESVSNQIALFEEMLQAESSQRDELADEDVTPNEALVQVQEQCQVSQSNISNFVQTVTDADQLSQLLALNDRLTSAFARYGELFATKQEKTVTAEPESTPSETVSVEWENAADNELLNSSFQIGDINDEDEDDLVPLSRPAMEVPSKNLEELRKEKDLEEGLSFRQNK